MAGDRRGAWIHRLEGICWFKHSPPKVLKAASCKTLQFTSGTPDCTKFCDGICYAGIKLRLSYCFIYRNRSDLLKNRIQPVDCRWIQHGENSNNFKNSKKKKERTKPTKTPKRKKNIVNIWQCRSTVILLRAFTNMSFNKYSYLLNNSNRYTCFQLVTRICQRLYQTMLSHNFFKGRTERIKSLSTSFIHHVLHSHA